MFYALKENIQALIEDQSLKSIPRKAIHINNQLMLVLFLVICCTVFPSWYLSNEGYTNVERYGAYM